MRCCFWKPKASSIDLQEDSDDEDCIPQQTSTIQKQEAGENGVVMESQCDCTDQTADVHGADWQFVPDAHDNFWDPVQGAGSENSRKNSLRPEFEESEMSSKPRPLQSIQEPNVETPHVGGTKPYPLDASQEFADIEVETYPRETINTVPAASVEEEIAPASGRQHDEEKHGQPQSESALCSDQVLKVESVANECANLDREKGACNIPQSNEGAKHSETPPLENGLALSIGQAVSEEACPTQSKPNQPDDSKLATPMGQGLVKHEGHAPDEAPAEPADSDQQVSSDGRERTFESELYAERACHAPVTPDSSICIQRRNEEVFVTVTPNAESIADDVKAQEHDPVRPDPMTVDNAPSDEKVVLPLTPDIFSEVEVLAPELQDSFECCVPSCADKQALMSNSLDKSPFDPRPTKHAARSSSGNDRALEEEGVLLDDAEFVCGFHFTCVGSGHVLLVRKEVDASFYTVVLDGVECAQVKSRFNNPAIQHAKLNFLIVPTKSPRPLPACLRLFFNADMGISDCTLSVNMINVHSYWHRYRGASANGIPEPVVIPISSQMNIQAKPHSTCRSGQFSYEMADTESSTHQLGQNLLDGNADPAIPRVSEFVANITDDLSCVSMPISNDAAEFDDGRCERLRDLAMQMFHRLDAGGPGKLSLSDISFFGRLCGRVFDVNVLSQRFSWNRRRGLTITEFTDFVTDACSVGYCTEQQMRHLLCCPWSRIILAPPVVREEEERLKQLVRRGKKHRRCRTPASLPWPPRAIPTAVFLSNPSQEKADTFVQSCRGIQIASDEGSLIEVIPEIRPHLHLGARKSEKELCDLSSTVPSTAPSTVRSPSLGNSEQSQTPSMTLGSKAPSSRNSANSSGSHLSTTRILINALRLWMQRQRLDNSDLEQMSFLIQRVEDHFRVSAPSQLSTNDSAGSGSAPGSCSATSEIQAIVQRIAAVREEILRSKGASSTMTIGSSRKAMNEQPGKRQKHEDRTLTTIASSHRPSDSPNVCGTAGSRHSHSGIDQAPDSENVEASEDKTNGMLPQRAVVNVCIRRLGPDTNQNKISTASEAAPPDCEIPRSERCLLMAGAVGNELSAAFNPITMLKPDLGLPIQPWDGQVGQSTASRTRRRRKKSTSHTCEQGDVSVQEPSARRAPIQHPAVEIAPNEELVLALKDLATKRDAEIYAINRRVEDAECRIEALIQAKFRKTNKREANNTH